MINKKSQDQIKSLIKEEVWKDLKKKKEDFYVVVKAVYDPKTSAVTYKDVDKNKKKTFASTSEARAYLNKLLQQNPQESYTIVKYHFDTDTDKTKKPKKQPKTESKTLVAEGIKDKIRRLKLPDVPATERKAKQDEIIAWLQVNQNKENMMDWVGGAQTIKYSDFVAKKTEYENTDEYKRKKAKRDRHERVRQQSDAAKLFEGDSGFEILDENDKFIFVAVYNVDASRKCALADIGGKTAGWCVSNRNSRDTALQYWTNYNKPALPPFLAANSMNRDFTIARGGKRVIDLIENRYCGSIFVFALDKRYNDGTGRQNIKYMMQGFFDYYDKKLIDGAFLFWNQADNLEPCTEIEGTDDAGNEVTINGSDSPSKTAALKRLFEKFNVRKLMAQNSSFMSEQKVAREIETMRNELEAKRVREERLRTEVVKITDQLQKIDRGETKILDYSVIDCSKSAKLFKDIQKRAFAPNETREEIDKVSSILSKVETIVYPKIPYFSPILWPKDLSRDGYYYEWITDVYQNLKTVDFGKTGCDVNRIDDDEFGTVSDFIDAFSFKKPKVVKAINTEHTSVLFCLNSSDSDLTDEERKTTLAKNGLKKYKTQIGKGKIFIFKDVIEDAYKAAFKKFIGDADVILNRLEQIKAQINENGLLDLSFISDYSLTLFAFSTLLNNTSEYSEFYLGEELRSKVKTLIYPNVDKLVICENDAFSLTYTLYNMDYLESLRFPKKIIDVYCPNERLSLVETINRFANNVCGESAPSFKIENFENFGFFEMINSSMTTSSPLYHAIDDSSFDGGWNESLLNNFKILKYIKSAIVSDINNSRPVQKFIRNELLTIITQKLNNIPDSEKTGPDRLAIKATELSRKIAEDGTLDLSYIETITDAIDAFACLFNNTGVKTGYDQMLDSDIVRRIKTLIYPNIDTLVLLDGRPYNYRFSCWRLSNLQNITFPKKIVKIHTGNSNQLQLKEVFEKFISDHSSGTRINITNAENFDLFEIWKFIYSPEGSRMIEHPYSNRDMGIDEWRPEYINKKSVLEKIKAYLDRLYYPFGNVIAKQYKPIIDAKIRSIEAASRSSTSDTATSRTAQASTTQGGILGLLQRNALEESRIEAADSYTIRNFASIVPEDSVRLEQTIRNNSRQTADWNVIANILEHKSKLWPKIKNMNDSEIDPRLKVAIYYKDSDTHSSRLSRNAMDSKHIYLVNKLKAKQLKNIFNYTGFSQWRRNTSDAETSSASLIADELYSTLLNNAETIQFVTTSIFEIFKVVRKQSPDEDSGRDRTKFFAIALVKDNLFIKRTDF